MKEHTYHRTAATIFLLVALLHGLRILNGWEAVIGGVDVPMWFSGAAVVLALYLSWRGFKLAKSH